MIICAAVSCQRPSLNTNDCVPYHLSSTRLLVPLISILMNSPLARFSRIAHDMGGVPESPSTTAERIRYHRLPSRAGAVCISLPLRGDDGASYALRDTTRSERPGVMSWSRQGHRLTQKPAGRGHTEAGARHRPASFDPATPLPYLRTASSEILQFDIVNLPGGNYDV